MSEGEKKALAVVVALTILFSAIYVGSLWPSNGNEPSNQNIPEETQPDDEDLSFVFMILTEKYIRRERQNISRIEFVLDIERMNKTDWHYEIEGSYEKVMNNPFNISLYENIDGNETSKLIGFEITVEYQNKPPYQFEMKQEAEGCSDT